MNSTNQPLDLIVVGGGLSGLLTAWLRLVEHPNERVMVLESAPQLAGDHTWSFNLSDIAITLLLHLDRMITHQWDAYEVRFPKFCRTLHSAYATSNSESLRQAIEPLLLSGQLIARTAIPVAKVEPNVVHLAEGGQISARAVVDARGGLPHSSMQLAYQKFVGLTVRTERPHGLSHPRLMDATVPQLDGYRFLYCLPFSETEILIEDTYYSGQPRLDVEDYEQRVYHYAQQQDWQIAGVLRREQGVLPIALSCDANAALSDEMGSAPKIGLAGGVFHATTGYSLPDAVRLAAAIARISVLDAENLAKTIVDYRREHARRNTFFRRLNRMLFDAADADQRYKVLQRFYQLDEGLIQRFYAGALRPLDKARILCGRPPVPVRPAMGVMNEQRYRRKTRAAS